MIHGCILMLCLASNTQPAPSRAPSRMPEWPTRRVSQIISTSPVGRVEDSPGVRPCALPAFAQRLRPSPFVSLDAKGVQVTNLSAARAATKGRQRRRGILPRVFSSYAPQAPRRTLRHQRHPVPPPACGGARGGSSALPVLARAENLRKKTRRSHVQPPVPSR